MSLASMIEIEAPLVTVLLLEDDPLVASTIARMLKARGHAVVACESADAALRLCREHPTSIELLLTDVNALGPLARCMATQARALRPDMKVVFMSGSSEQTLLTQGLVEPGAHFIEKPFSPNALTLTLNAAFGWTAAAPC